MGYLLETLGFIEITDSLFKKANGANLKFRKYLLCIKKQSMNLTYFPVNKKWKIIINEKIEPDEFLTSRLSFRGGTALALHKLYLSPQSRYSKVIDLVQIQS